MKQVALIFGGPSAEHDVSLVSAKNIMEVLLQIPDITPHFLGVTRQGQWKMLSADELRQTSFQKPLNLDDCGKKVAWQMAHGRPLISDDDGQNIGPFDVAFPIIHGTYGEDGQLQTELEQLKLTYVGTPSEGCLNSFDKVRTKEILSHKQVPQVPYLFFEKDAAPSWSEVTDQLGSIVFIKPASMGSSIGISKVRNSDQYLLAIKEAQKHDSKILIEKALKVREIECALLQDDELHVTGMGEVIPNHEFYSYEAKYLDANGAQIVIPASVSPTLTREIQEIAKVCFIGLGCRDYARADFFIDDSGQVYFNEINTHPGFTSISQFPLLWQHEGVAYSDLIIKLLDQAIKRTSQSH
jgi:D-alanine-D-alanine ligase